MKHRDNLIWRLINRFFGEHRTCFRCGKPIKQRHRWKHVNHQFLFWVVTYPEHRNCHHPELSSTPHRLNSDVPLPFPEPEDSFHTGENPA